MELKLRREMTEYGWLPLSNKYQGMRHGERQGKRNRETHLVATIQRRVDYERKKNRVKDIETKGQGVMAGDVESQDVVDLYEPIECDQ